MSWIDPDAFLRLVRGQTKGPAAGLARLGLGLASGGYRATVGIRNGLYNRGWRQVHRAQVPVLSVGNITVGGTGKTPMVEWLARWFRRHGVRVTLISRGYGHAGGVNDEGMVLEDNLPDVPHLQDPDRVALAAIAVHELEAELIILDDGFQHRRMGRDLDLVMLDALDPFGLGRLLPRGLLREPISSLRRASAIILSREDLIEAGERAAIRDRIRARGCSIPFIETRHAPLNLIDGEGTGFPLSDLQGRSIAAFCGIGNPEGFRRTIEPLCERIAEFRIFPDHHRYTAEDVAGLSSWAKASEADLVLTTQKDLVKLRTSALGPVPLRAMRIGLEVTEGLAALEELLRPLVPAPRSSPVEGAEPDHAVPPSTD